MSDLPLLACADADVAPGSCEALFHVADVRPVKQPRCFPLLRTQPGDIAPDLGKPTSDAAVLQSDLWSVVYYTLRAPCCTLLCRSWRGDRRSDPRSCRCFAREY